MNVRRCIRGNRRRPFHTRRDVALFDQNREERRPTVGAEAPQIDEH